MASAKLERWTVEEEKFIVVFFPVKKDATRNNAHYGYNLVVCCDCCFSPSAKGLSRNGVQLSPMKGKRFSFPPGRPRRGRRAGEDWQVPGVLEVQRNCDALDESGKK